MKLFFVNCLLLFMFILFPMHSGYCDFFEGWQQGAAIGASIRESIERNRMLHGNQNQDIYVNKYYDFSKVHNMYLYVVLPNNQYVDDIYIVNTYTDNLQEAFNKTPVKVSTPRDVFNKVHQIYPNFYNLPDKEKAMIFNKYISENFDAVLCVSIFAYNELRESNVVIGYNIREMKGTNVIFNDNDVRVNVLDASKQKLLVKMTDKFIKEFLKAISNNNKK